MGSDRGDAVQDGALNRPSVAQVVPDVPTFAVDDGFAYAIPDSLADQLSVGALVRVPLGGRRVRGYVTALRSGATDGLKDILSISGDLPVVTPALLETLRWAALHYVAPMAAMLAKAAPPGLPRRLPDRDLDGLPVRTPSRLEALSDAIAAGKHSRPSHLLGPGPFVDEAAELAGAALSEGRSALLIAPSVVEVHALAERLRSSFGNRVITAASSYRARPLTEAWTAAASHPGIVVVATREASFWPIARLAVAVVIGEGRRGLKDRQTPTTHARDVLRRRAAVERFTLVTASSVPSAEVLASGAALVEAPGRAWPLVELADRTEDPPGGGVLGERATVALRGALKAGGRAFVLARTRGYAPAFACVACGRVRRCAACGAGGGRAADCPRCGRHLGPCADCGGATFRPLGAGLERITEELRRLLGSDSVGAAGSGSPVEAGTERDLLIVQGMALSIVVDGDGLLLAPSYRAEEEALRLMARTAQMVERGRGRRCLIQTAMPDHPVYSALRRGDPLAFLEAELERRAAEGFPPAGELLVVEIEDGPAEAGDQLQALAGSGVVVHGPAETRDRLRWLVQGADLSAARVGLRGLVQRWREGGSRVRIDADPLEL